MVLAKEVSGVLHLAQPKGEETQRTHWWCDRWRHRWHDVTECGSQWWRIILWGVYKRKLGTINHWSILKLKLQDSDCSWICWLSMSKAEFMVVFQSWRRRRQIFSFPVISHDPFFIISAKKTFEKILGVPLRYDQYISILFSTQYIPILRTPLKYQAN